MLESAKQSNNGNTPPRLKDSRLILHFDYDCFYASVFEAENPALKYLPLAVQQKQIIVTCNYEARKRGLYKLQLITEAKKVCPDVVIVLGEDLTRFRNASKELYAFLASHIWSKRCERLGFDEVWLDVTDMIDFNMELVNHGDPSSSYFHLDRNDPIKGFIYDAMTLVGHSCPSNEKHTEPKPGVTGLSNPNTENLELRLILGAHLAQYLRFRLEEEKNYTATVGIAVNKLLSKLVGNCHKPRSQTTLAMASDQSVSPENITISFLDEHDIGKVPGIGFKLSQKLRRLVLGRDPKFSEDLVYGGTKENVSVRDVRLFSSMGPKVLEEVLAGPGAQKGIGIKIWNLLHGVDDTEVSKMKPVPTQISLEDSYMRLDTIDQVQKELLSLSLSLMKRMYLDLTEVSTDSGERQWLAIPHTLRLSTRPRPPVGPDGRRPRSFNRISKSGPMPTFILSKMEDQRTIAARLATEVLYPMFKKLHPEKSGWNLSLINIAATGMHETASGDGGASGRDIGTMFRRQEEVLKDWKVEDKDMPPDHAETDSRGEHCGGPDEMAPVVSHGQFLQVEPTRGQSRSTILETSGGSEDIMFPSQSSVCEDEDGWQSEVSLAAAYGEACPICNAAMPAFAFEAHLRYHEMETG